MKKGTLSDYESNNSTVFYSIIQLLGGLGPGAHVRALGNV